MWGAQNNPESCSGGRGRRRLPRPEALYEAAAARCRPGKATAIKADRTYIAAEKWELPVTGLMMFEQPLALHSTDPPCRHWPPSPNPQRDLRGKGGEQRPPTPAIFYVGRFLGQDGEKRAEKESNPCRGEQRGWFCGDRGKLKLPQLSEGSASYSGIYGPCLLPVVLHRCCGTTTAREGLVWLVLTPGDSQPFFCFPSAYHTHPLPAHHRARLGKGPSPHPQLLPQRQPSPRRHAKAELNQLLEPGPGAGSHSEAGACFSPGKNQGLQDQESGAL